MPSHGLSHPNPYGSLMSLGGYPHPGSSGFHENIFNQGDIGHTQLPPLSSLDFPWNHFPPPTHHHQDPFGQIQRTLSNPGTSSYQFGSASHAPENTSISNTASTSRQPRRASVHNPAVASSSTSSPDPENQTEAERIAIAEEKRRRNTAASGEFLAVMLCPFRVFEDPNAVIVRSAFPYKEEAEDDKSRAVCF